MSHHPIAYTYEANHHCEHCAFKRFGRNDQGDIVGTDREGNPVGVIAPWDEWQQDLTEPQTLACGTCGVVIEEFTL